MLAHARREGDFAAGRVEVRALDRQGREAWEEAGGTDAWTRAKEIARRILAEHQPEALDPQVDEWIRERFASSLML